MGNKKFNQIEINKIIDLYNSGLLQREIADMFTLKPAKRFIDMLHQNRQSVDVYEKTELHQGL